MTENEDKLLIKTKNIMPFENFNIVENMYLRLPAILNNYSRFYY